MTAPKMGLALASLAALAAFAPLAGAQTPPEPAPPPAAAPPTTTLPPAAPPTTAAPVAPPTETAAPPAAMAPAPPTIAPTTPPSAAPATEASTPPPPPPAVVAEAPPPPPGPPTDPTAIALLKTLDDVCVPSAAHGDKDLGKAAKADGFRKSGDNWVFKGVGFQFTLLPPGSNPNVCQVQLTHPIDPNVPAAALATALHNWATFGHGYNPVSNYQHAQGDQFIVRAWEKSENGVNEALVLTTTRKPDGSPEMRNADTSTMMYSVNKAAS